MDELMSLADPTNSTPSVLHLPVGHPFLNDSDLYWAADHIPDDLSDGSLLVIFKSTFSVAVRSPITLVFPLLE
jgi:hypothetical protein